MIKVLMVGNDPSVKGGITSVINQLLSHNWIQDGIEMKFIPTYIETNNLKKILFFICAFKKIIKEFRYNKPDIVHMHMSYRGSFTRKFLIYKLCCIYNIPFIVHLHGSEFKKWFDCVDKRKQEKIRMLMKESKAFIVLGDNWDKVIREIEPDTNTVIVSNTIHIPKESVKWDNPFRILFLGVLIKRKGVSDLLKATELLKSKLNNQKFKVIIAGSGSEYKNLKEETNSLKLNDVVEFVGWTDGEKKNNLLKSCQCLVLPSYNEGLPVCILEGISYGMPIIATNVGDISSAVNDNVNGYLIEPGDYKKLEGCIFKIASDYNRFIEFSKNSKLNALKFSDTNYFKAIKNCYY